jgi:hypothetical protein
MFIKFFFAMTLPPQQPLVNIIHPKLVADLQQSPVFFTNKIRESYCVRVAYCVWLLWLWLKRKNLRPSIHTSKKDFFPGHSFFFFQIEHNGHGSIPAEVTRVERKTPFKPTVAVYTYGNWTSWDDTQQFLRVDRQVSDTQQEMFFSDGNREVCARAHYSRLCIVCNCACREYTRGVFFRPRLMNNHIKFFI